jgi:uncharacterized glyoxalase superfamily protein PhnB
VKLNTIFPVITTRKLQESKHFYTHFFNFSVVFENDWYLHLAHGAFQLAFMLPDHCSQHDIFKPAFNCKGLTLSFEIDDVVEQQQRFSEAGLEIKMDLQEEEWGELHFALCDPNGLVVNVTQMVEPSEEYKLHYFDVVAFN